jgi:predicted nucleic acid-binding protein
VIVADASAVLELLLRTKAAAQVEKLLFAGTESLHAPHLLDVEVTQVLRRYAAMGEIDSSRAELALRDLADLPLMRHDHLPLLQKIWEWRHNLTAYDAVYVALAAAMDAVLLTRDARMAAAAKSSVRVVVVS